MSIILTNDNRIDGLLSGYSWSGNTETSATVTFGFDRKTWPHAGDVPLEFDFPVVSPSAEQRQLIRDALESWSNVAAVRFVETSDMTEADLCFSRAPSKQFSGYTETIYVPGNEQDLTASEIYLDSALFTDNSGALATSIILHEIGHSLGLKHPHDGGLADNPLLNEKYDSFSYTVMSYNQDVSGGPASDVLPVGPQVLDILALQYLYGANTAYHAQDNVYTLDGVHSVDGRDDTGKLFANYTSVGTALWDAGGQDLIDASDADAGVTIDLREGEKYVTRAGETEWRIAHGAVIENAEGSDFNDSITGNASDNIFDDGAGADVVRGLAGDDTFNAGAGSDRYEGGIGSDSVSYEGFSASMTVDLAAGTANGAQTGADRLVSIENAQGGSGADVILGSGADNFLSGGLGADRLDGRGGDDVIFGDAGNDRIFGGAGQDLINFAEIDASVTVNLAQGKASSALTGLDTLSGVENVATGLGADRITGDHLDNLFLSGAGNDKVFGGLGEDIFVGGSGNDYFSGGGGDDTVSYFGSRSAVKVDLIAQTASGADVGTDTFFSMEGAQGGSGADTLIGNGLANVLYGGAGKDTLNGGLGNDTLTGDAGTDKLFGGAGRDVFSYSDQSDSSLAKGVDLIRDFDVGEDRLNVSELGYFSIEGFVSEYNSATGVTTLSRTGDDFVVKFTGNIVFDDADFIFA